ncbi:MAG: SUMF1/EgtB/PvdO family nonheme iron enzyme [Planctomycetota bacterium]
MRNARVLAVVVCVMAVVNTASADTFGSGVNEFTIDFVPVSGSTNPTSGIPAGYGFTFTGVNYDYRMGRFEITNDQWSKFTNIYGTPTGSSSSAYDGSPYWTGTNVPTNEVSWYEAAQFVNYLNTSKGYSQAYKFTGTQGQSDYTFMPWDVTDTGYDAGDPYRNSNAFYFLPTENEWVKAGYWNGTALQTYALKAGESLTQGNGTSGTGWNYYTTHVGYATSPFGPWTVGSGSGELNGTFDMMGNVFEWTEMMVYNSERGLRGGSYHADYGPSYLESSCRINGNPSDEYDFLGFRVASVPEPATVLLFGLGAVLLRK